MSGSAALPIVGKVTSPSTTLYLAAALLLVSVIAGWSLWRLAGAGPRCDAKVSELRAEGSRAVTKLAADQLKAVNLLKAEQTAAVMQAWAAMPSAETREVVRWRTKWRVAGQAPFCTFNEQQVQSIRAALRNGEVQP